MCRIDELCRKDVINVKDGNRLGNICDIEVDAVEGRIVSLVIYGRAKYLGIFGREDDIVIPWSSIQTIGDDTVLVCVEIQPRCRRRQGSPFKNFFR